VEGLEFRGKTREERARLPWKKERAEGLQGIVCQALPGLDRIQAFDEALTLSASMGRR